MKTIAVELSSGQIADLIIGDYVTIEGTDVKMHVVDRDGQIAVSFSRGDQPVVVLDRKPA